MNSSQTAYLNAFHLIDELYSSGVRSLWISPGFRNSPLIAAAQMFAEKNRGFSVSTAIDERGSGFAALGEALASKRAVAVACTSGTAVANLYPAVLEARYSGVPLIIISCDRPQELLGVGANQTMEQWDFFQSARCFFAAVPANSGEMRALENLRYLTAKAIFRSVSESCPAHLNISFREPFAFDQATIDGIAPEYLQISRPNFTETSRVPTSKAKNIVCEKVSAANNVLLIASIGACSADQQNRLARIAERNGWANYFEGSPSDFNYADFILNNSDAAQPDLVIRFGAPVLGKEITASITRAPLGQIIFDASEDARNPDYGEVLFAEGDVEAWIPVLAELGSKPGNFRKDCAQKNSEMHGEISTLLDESTHFTEWHAIRSVAKNLRDGTNFFLGNSMPVRDYLWVGASCANAEYNVFSNRGLSGIDGLIATACGIAKTGGDTIAVIGDLSAVHDSSSFSLLSALRNTIHLKLLIVNNGGGEIFRFVDTSRYPTDPKHFTTPVEISFQDLAAAYRLPFVKAGSEKELEKVLMSRSPGIEVVEIVVDQAESTRFRKEFFARWKK